MGSADRHVSYKDSHGGSATLRQQLSFFINQRVPRISNPIQPNLVNMSSGATSSETESGRMVIQAPFIIAPTHQTTIAASKIKESASVGSQEEEDGPQPLVMSGPSGAGKSTLIKRLMAQFNNSFGFSVSHTTRSPRAGEEDGVAYNFVSQQQMKEAIANGEFIEHATFAGNTYGTSTAAVQRVRSKGLICILDIDIQGVKSIKETDISCNYIFVQPPSMEILKQRLQGRGTETEESLEKRLSQGAADMKYGTGEGNFDIVITNNDIEAAYDEFLAFLKARYPSLT